MGNEHEKNQAAPANKVIDPNSRDYSFDDIVEDERFVVCRREAIVSIIMYFVLAGSMLVAMYVVGAGDPTQYSYILGMPTWYFAVGLCAIGAIVILNILLSKYYRHMSLDPEGELEPRGMKDTQNAASDDD